MFSPERYTRFELSSNIPLDSAFVHARAAPRAGPERRSELLDLGRRLFARHAYDELSIDEIAARAGVAKGLLYYYFGSKRGYYVAVVQAAAAELRERTATDPADPPALRLAAALDAYLSYVEEHADGYRALISGGVGTDDEVRAIVEGERARQLAIVAEALGTGRKPPPALRAALEGWMSFLEGVSLDWLAHRDLERDAARALIVQALAGAIGAARAIDPSVRADPTAVTG
jgi:AcrR family transcriptional regulator